METGGRMSSTVRVHTRGRTTLYTQAIGWKADAPEKEYASTMTRADTKANFNTTCAMEKVYLPTTTGALTKVGSLTTLRMAKELSLGLIRLSSKANGRTARVVRELL